ncbi:unnamed protein product [Allacma fusca]|uniref:Enolase-phosphatase E1 n=1 Tax=Allacma fusca TaxID=39272 RepID=A0A8J2MDI5_9HEXA|nr:unnamed protein product [Allacma fusca]
MANSPSLEGAKVILLDIEGTTTSISFVKDVLFPYARANVEAYLRKQWGDDDTKAILRDLQALAEQDISDGVEGVKPILPLTDSAQVPEDVLQSVLKNIFWQMDLDRKTTPLKLLQGKIWKSGYDKGELKGHVYADVPEAFIRWTTQGKKLYIYSSGSVQAQILLFGHSEAGDLCKYLSGYFDTTTGYKNETTSYTTIASKIGVQPEDILFLTDVAAEAFAASDAGMQVQVLIRPGNKPLLESELEAFRTIQDFTVL